MPKSAPVRSRGAITLVFDDGYTSVFNHVVPLLDTLKFPGVFAIPLVPGESKLDEQEITSWSEWLPLAERGHEIAAHGVTHSNLTTVSPGELTTELTVPQKQLKATTLVYPGGAYNEAVRAAAQPLYQAARTVKKGLEKMPPHTPYELTTYNFTRTNFSVWRANSLALWAWLTGRWLIETYHVIDDTLPVVHSVRLHDFARHLAFIKRLPIRVRTIQDIINTV